MSWTKRCSFSDPRGPPSADVPLSEMSITMVLSSVPISRKASSTLAICASVWVRNPAKTSISRAYNLRSSAPSSPHGCTHGAAP